MNKKALLWCGEPGFDKRAYGLHAFQTTWFTEMTMLKNFANVFKELATGKKMINLPYFKPS